MMHADHSFANRHPRTNALLVASVLAAHASRRAYNERAFAREEHIHRLRQDRVRVALAVAERCRRRASSAAAAVRRSDPIEAFFADADRSHLDTIRTV